MRHETHTSNTLPKHVPELQDDGSTGMQTLQLIVMNHLQPIFNLEAKESLDMSSGITVQILGILDFWDVSPNELTFLAQGVSMLDSSTLDVSGHNTFKTRSCDLIVLENTFLYLLQSLEKVFLFLHSSPSAVTHNSSYFNQRGTPESCTSAVPKMTSSISLTLVLAVLLVCPPSQSCCHPSGASSL